MRLPSRFPVLAAGLLTCFSPFTVFAGTESAEIAATVPNPALSNALPATLLDEAIRQLKEQQSSTTQTLDLIRRDTESALQHNARAVSNQLTELGRTLVRHGAQQFELMRAAEQRNLRVIAAILGVILFAGSVVVWLAVRTLNRLSNHSMPAALLPVGEATPPSHTLIESAATTAYSTALGEVERRVSNLENQRAARVTTTGSPQPLAPKPRLAPRLAMTLGSGEALVFLPGEEPKPLTRRLRQWLGRMRGVFGRTDTGRAEVSCNEKE